MAQTDSSSFILRRNSFSEKEREIARFGDLVVYGFRYDTGVVGNSNGGHLWGTTLNADDKRAMIEYLKTL